LPGCASSTSAAAIARFCRVHSRGAPERMTARCSVKQAAKAWHAAHEQGMHRLHGQPGAWDRTGITSGACPGVPHRRPGRRLEPHAASSPGGRVHRRERAEPRSEPHRRDSCTPSAHPAARAYRFGSETAQDARSSSAPQHRSRLACQQDEGLSR
jgi:hypothetical protein